MIHSSELVTYLADYLQIHQFKDYAPNGLQIEGKKEIQRLVTGVSAGQALIEQAIDLKADAILVHHGFFWKNEAPQIVGMKQKRIKALLTHDINLFGYHLPLDAHPELGNNVRLAHQLGIQNPRPIVGVAQGLVWQGELAAPMSAQAFSAQIEQGLDRKPLLLGQAEQNIHTVAWCTGGAQDYIDIAFDQGVDAFITGEVSERTFYSATEQDVVFYAAGHHATERYGIQALGEHLAKTFNLEHHFIEINNPV